MYLTRTEVLMEQDSIKGSDCRAWIIPQERSWNIDTPFDLFIVEQMMKREQMLSREQEAGREAVAV